VKETFLGNQKMPPAHEVCISGEEMEVPPATSSDSGIHPLRDVVTTGTGHLQKERERNRQQMGEGMNGGH